MLLSDRRSTDVLELPQVWPAHKLVCGKPGLSPPVLSQVELRELDQFADVRVLFDTTALGDIMFKRPREGSNEGRTVRQQCHDMWPMPLENVGPHPTLCHHARQVLTGG